jgi:membrane protease subunit (stomatin/prohibitin family)
MGLFDKVKTKLVNEFIDIIEWADDSKDTIVWKFPRYNNEIKNGAQLIVRPGQAAVLVDEGKLADVFTEGRHVLDTNNIPLLSTIKGWKYGFNSPFKVDIFFVSLRDFTNQKWGTKNPIMLRDAEFGPIRVRAFGSYQFKVTSPENVLRKLSTTNEKYTVEDINDQLRNIIVTRFTDVIGEAKIPVLDVASNMNEFSELLHKNMDSEFTDYGFGITKFLVENVSLPPEVEAMLDKRSSMGILGDMNKFMQFSAANSLETAAKNEGMGGAFVGAGMGMGMGNMMGGMMQNSMNQNNNTGGNNTPPPPPPMVQYFIAVNGAQQGPFDANTISQMISGGQITKATMMWKNGMAGWSTADTIAELAQYFNAVPPPPPPPPPAP